MNKFILALAALLIGSATFAQTKKPPQPQRGEIADQQACWQQAHAYVDKINAANDPVPTDFVIAHYDPASKICYVQTRHARFSANIGAVNSWEVDLISVDDAFEGKNYASYVGTFVVQSDGSWKEKENPAHKECQVNGETCSSRATFNGLLWKFIPAFRPVDAVDVR